ncbi:amidohydrolase/deacetylase family metallohydrolase [Martelella soudanensis]|uniref:amidohydrolase/deacetylase family metallohydrolase n=1 Tax=unclassified Martelella TaxID=2629616 RepID=UPI0015DE9DE3|nr:MULTISPECIES: amidohydrolase/deacetylase family metallohydrolase [unclassified Martelella]
MAKFLIRGGRIIDPASGFDAIADVATEGTRITAIAPDILPDGHQVIEAGGLLVMPGLVDLHTHAYWAGTLLGVNADKIGPRSGVTTWVDCGSAGAATFEGFYHHVIKSARMRIIPFLNLSYIGLTPAGNLSLEVGELCDWRFADLKEIGRIARQFPGEVAGIKLRASNNATGGNAGVVLPLAREAADMLGVPLMVHVGLAPPVLEEVLPFLKAGDILTHIFNPAPGGASIGADGRIKPALKDAIARGVRLDVGHGGASFSFTHAEAALADGLAFDAISTDLHAHNIAGPVFDLPHVMAKFLALGMPLAEVLRLATSAPADVLGRPELGRLAEGGEADIALFRLAEGDFTFIDSLGATRKSRMKLENVMTMRAGEPATPVDDGREDARRY